MRIVLTGATSMIGIEIIKQCIDNGDIVYAICRKNSKKLERIPKSSLVHIIYSNLNELNNIDQKNLKADVFYHLAWDKTSNKERKNIEDQANNIIYTLEAVKLANKFGCKKFIGAGSQAEYGVVNDIINEKTHTNPVTAYGASKLAAYRLSKLLCEKLNICHIWTRIFSVYGEYDNENSLISYAIRQFYKGKIAKFSAATNYWNYLHASDAGTIIYLLGKLNIKGGVYCVANQESRLLKDYINIICNQYNGDIHYEFNKNNPTNCPNLNVDVSKTLNSVNYTPQNSFEESIIKIIKYKKELYEKEN